MKTQTRRCWSCTIAIPRRKRLKPDRRARCPRRSTNSKSFSPAWDQVRRQNDAANRSNKRFRAAFGSARGHHIVQAEHADEGRAHRRLASTVRRVEVRPAGRGAEVVGGELGG